MNTRLRSGIYGHTLRRHSPRARAPTHTYTHTHTHTHTYIHTHTHTQTHTHTHTNISPTLLCETEVLGVCVCVSNNPTTGVAYITLTALEVLIDMLARSLHMCGKTHSYAFHNPRVRVT